MGESVSIPDMRMKARILPILLVFLVPYVLSSEVGVHFCCEDGKNLFYSSRESILQLGTIMSAKCVPSRDRKHREPLEEKFLMTIDPSRTEGEDGRHVRRKINNIGDWNLDCSMGAIKTFLDLDNEGLEPAPTVKTPSYDIKLEAYGSESSNGMGNVILNGKNICDDGWGDKEASVACRMLGYLEGTPKNEAHFGEAKSSEFIMDDVECTGEEDDLFECRYNPRDDCGWRETAGVICEGFLGPSNSSVTVDGDLVKETGEKVEAGTFCLAQDTRIEGKVLAVQCVTPKVLSLLSEELWKVISAANGDYWRRYGSDPLGEYNQREEHGVDWPNVLQFIGYQQDGFITLDKTVYENFINEMVKFLVELMDETGDGIIEANIEGKPFENIGFRLLDGILKKLFIYFDTNEDDVVSLVEFAPDFRRNSTLNLESLFGKPVNQWPNPLFKFYTTLDADQNEELSMEEWKNFVKRTFTVMDANEDCKISIEEIRTLITNMGMLNAYGLALESILFPYFHLADFLLTEFFKQADIDRDEKTTLEEILNFDDWNWVDDMVITAVHIGYPYDNYGPAAYLAGENIFNRHHQSNRPNEIHDKLLEALGNLMDLPAYSSPPSDVCVIDI